MLKKKEVILVKIETTYNTDPTPATSANEVFVDSIEVSNEGLRMLERKGPKKTLGGYKPVYAGTLKAIKIALRARGSGAAGTAPEFGPLLRACGFGETLNASTSAVYAPVSSGFESVTIYRYHDGKLHKFTGCVGNVSLSQETGNFHVFTFNMVGHFVSETDVALATPSYDTTVPIPAIGGTFSIASYGAVIGTLNIDMGNTIATPPDYNQTDGYGKCQITDRKVTGSIDPEDVLVATHDFYTKFTAGTAMAMTTSAIGPAAGNKMALSLPAVVYTGVSEGDRDGVRTRLLEFEANESTGDDQITITFT